MNRTTDVVILGGGPAGLSAAIWCKRLGVRHLLLEQERELGGQLHFIQNEIIDYPGLVVPNGVEMKRVFEDNVRLLGCEVQTGVQVLEVDTRRRVLWMQPPTAGGDGQGDVHFRALIVATGSSDRRLQVPGEAEMMVRGEVYSATRDRARFSGQNVVVVGGGDRAFEGALLLADSGAHVTLIHRSQHFRAREEFTERVLHHSGIAVLADAQVTRIHGKEQVTGVEVRSQDGCVQEVAAAAIFVRIGVAPNTQLLQGQVRVDADGYVQTDEVGQTSQERVMAIGDVCTRPLYSSIAKAVGQGMTAAKHLSVVLAQREEFQ